MLLPFWDVSYRDSQYVSDKERKEKGQGKTERNGLQDYPVKELRLREVKALAPGHMASKEQSWGSLRVGHCHGLHICCPGGQRELRATRRPRLHLLNPQGPEGLEASHGKTENHGMRNQGQRKQSGRESIWGTNKTIRNSGAILHLET